MNTTKALLIVRGEKVGVANIEFPWLLLDPSTEITINPKKDSIEKLPLRKYFKDLIETIAKDNEIEEMTIMYNLLVILFAEESSEERIKDIIKNVYNAFSKDYKNDTYIQKFDTTKEIKNFLAALSKVLDEL